MNQRQRKERNEKLAAALGIIAFVVLTILLTKHLISEAPAEEHRGAWVAFCSAFVAGFGVFLRVLLRVDASAESDSGNGWIWIATGMGLTINYVVDQLPIWVRGAIMGLVIAVPLAALVGGLIRMRQPQGMDSSK